MPLTAPAPATTYRPVLFACVALLLAYLPFAQVNAALGLLATATGADVGVVGWFSDAYAIALAVAVLPAGLLAPRAGPRRTTALGLSLTATGGLGLLLGWSLAPAAVLIAAEAVAGLGAALVLSGSFALITTTIPDVSGRARAIGFWSAALVAGLGGGPFLTAALLAVAPPQALLVPAAVLALVVAAWSRRIPDRVAEFGRLDLSVLRSRSLLGAALAAATTLFGIVGLVAVAGLRLAGTGVDPLGVAWHFAVLFATNAVAAVAAANLVRRFGFRRVLVGGLLIAGAGAALTTSLLVPGLFLVGAGGGLVMTTASAVAVAGLRAEQAATAGAITNTARQLGAALAPATVTSLLATGAGLPALVIAGLFVCVAPVILINTPEES